MEKRLIGLGRTACALLLASAASGCATGAEYDQIRLRPEEAREVFTRMPLELDNRKIGCAVWVPPEYEPDTPMPLVIFLHGIGERGRDGLKQATVGIGPAIKSHPGRFPCIVVMPQCPPGHWWGEPVYRFVQDVGNAGEVITLAIDKAKETYAIDESRIYLTGLSMGGFGTFTYGADHIEQFAALMPVCGGGLTEDAARLAQRPIWVFHGRRDISVPVNNSRRMVEAIQEAGGDVTYTEYPDARHSDAWERAYNDPEAIAWLLSHQLAAE